MGAGEPPASCPNQQAGVLGSTSGKAPAMPPNDFETRRTKPRAVTSVYWRQHLHDQARVTSYKHAQFLTRRLKLI
ncbi:hypothetical protein K440DRAFT_262210 [Wilcoxina mikolae CBS 423.85]|nr:hypothetical protein K440DRAFT_262210 [Wilcoxina mikolae CBS 423.85]